MALKQSRALKHLRYLIEAVLLETYEEGVAEGQDLLYNLAKGRLSTADLGEHDRRFAERIQDHRRKINKNLVEKETMNGYTY